MSARKISLTVNGQAVEAEVEARVNLADFVRQAIGLTGTHVGCEHGVCGACTIIVDGRPARACLMLAVQADGAEVETVESLGTPEALSELQQAFRDRHALQCGFCTPGMLMTIEALLRVEASPTREQVRDVLSGNLCRCTGYQAIVDAALDAAKARRGTR
ncbi:(2Fe-2S)-binding protein [Bradyrhizobium sp. CCBAU 51765]|uniref:(2Fe-2S)-binding protein n=1 Tax=Bradyrhizobium sp. CCBAU 51765 TaxID=1325102 RepID=UPI00188908A4|nr:(2Fe-2S)-binding protein [Bradyrhizobium sp. CCBAU 51765]QOZ08070.1 (2Fe-2S)-binding protein [Bradyrhizobium sp. CCBAU 51765]